MPEGAVGSKIAACLEYGADVVLRGAHVGESLVHLERLREERGLTLVHPYDDPEVLIGNGSCGLEILEDLPDVDVVVIGVGGGGLLGRRDRGAQGEPAVHPGLRRRAGRIERDAQGTRRR